MKYYHFMITYLRHSLFHSILHHMYIYNGCLHLHIDHLHRGCLNTHQNLKKKSTRRLKHNQHHLDRRKSIDNLLKLYSLFYHINSRIWKLFLERMVAIALDNILMSFI